MELDYVRDDLRLKETEELVEILAVRDEGEWQPEVFAVVEEVLRERGIVVDQAVRVFREQVQRATVCSQAPPTERLAAVATFATGEEAHLCCMTLAQGGVEAVCRGPSPEADAEGWQVQVPSGQAEAARQMLESALIPEGMDADEEGRRCPKCGFISEPLREGGALVCQVCGAVHEAP